MCLSRRITAFYLFEDNEKVALSDPGCRLSVTKTRQICSAFETKNLRVWPPPFHRQTRRQLYPDGGLKI